jgi:hypothetical protein
MSIKSVKNSMPANISRREGLATDEVFDTRRVVTTLEGLMTQVTQRDVSPDTVNAACNCADKIVDILRLHLDVERLRKRMTTKE